MIIFHLALFGVVVYYFMSFFHLIDGHQFGGAVALPD
jgi:hypothetical protein